MPKHSILAAAAVGALLVLSACSDRMTSSKNGPEISTLLLQAESAKTHPLTAAKSRELEAHIVEVILKDVSKEERDEFQRLLNPTVPTYGSKWELEPNAPDTKEVKLQLALMNALWDLRAERFAAEYRAKNPPFDSTGQTLVQIVFVPQLNDTAAVAMIYRRPDDKGRPFLVVREDSRNALEVFKLVQIAARGLQTDGASVDAERWTSLHRHDIENEPASNAPDVYQQMLEEKASFVTKTFPGLGQVRTVGIWLRTPKPNSPR